MLHERRRLVCGASPIPVEAVVGQLRRWEQREALVVRLVQPALLVQQRIRPFAAVPVDPRGQDEVVVAPGDVERVELQRAEPLDDAPDRVRPGRERPRRREQVAADEKAACRDAIDGEGARHVSILAACRTDPCRRRGDANFSQTECSKTVNGPSDRAGAPSDQVVLAALRPNACPGSRGPPAENRPRH